MPSDTLMLPKNPEVLASILESHAARERAALSYRRLVWMLVYHYLQGARVFEIFNPQTSTITASALDSEGRLEFQSQEVLALIDRVAGHLCSMDLRPSVDRVGTSLAALREKAGAQIVIENGISVQQLEQIKTPLCHMLVALGSVGLQGHILDLPTIGLTADLEVIHPRELFPFPSVGMDYTKQRGIMRRRTVPLEFLVDKFGGRIKTLLDKALLNAHARQYGEVLHSDSPEVSPGSLGGIPISVGLSSGRPDQNTMHVVTVHELWLEGERGTCKRYICQSGRSILHDQTFDDYSTYCPIGFARCMENGTFHGAGIFDLVFSYVREFEKLIKDVTNNMRDSLGMGTLVMPRGSFNTDTQLRELGRGLRYVHVEPDAFLIETQFKPFVVQPPTTGDAPGRMAAFLKQLTDSISPLPDLLREKGRVDSAAGLQFLGEQINRSVTTVTRNLTECFSSVYRACTAGMLTSLAQSPRPLPVSRLSLDLAGVVIDPNEYTVTFVENPIPDISKLTFGVAASSPANPLAIKREAVELLQLGIMSPEQFRRFCVKKGLDISLDLDADRAAYQSVVEDILILFRDGETPGEIVVTHYSSRPELQLAVLAEFMSSPKFKKASPAVQDAFAKWRDTLLSWAGLALPAAVPNPRDLAILSQNLSTQGPAGAVPVAPAAPEPASPVPAVMQE